jgi:hypothetical protein
VPGAVLEVKSVVNKVLIRVLYALQLSIWCSSEAVLENRAVGSAVAVLN